MTTFDITQDASDLPTGTVYKLLVGAIRYNILPERSKQEPPWKPPQPQLTSSNSYNSTPSPKTWPNPARSSSAGTSIPWPSSSAPAASWATPSKAPSGNPSAG